MNKSIEPILEEEDFEEITDSWDPMKEHYHSPMNTLKLDPEQEPECELTGEMIDVKIAGKEVCEFYLRYGQCADGQYCDRLHVDPQVRDKLMVVAKNYDTRTIRNRYTSSDLSLLELPPRPDLSILISITDVTSPSEFVFICPYEHMDFSNMTEQEILFYIDHVQQTSPYKTKLQMCHEQLEALFDHDYRVDNLNEDISRGQVVACRLEDGRFCRAIVVEPDNFIVDKFDYTLFLIDIGVCVDRPREDIFEIRASCLSEPSLVSYGRLDLKPTGGSMCWSEEVLDKFKQKLTSKSYVLCKILRYCPDEEKYLVDLIDIKTRASLAELMVMSGVAEMRRQQVKSGIDWNDF